MTQDSREVKRGSAFFAYDGLNFKGKDFIWDAFDKHATAVFVDREYKEEILNDARYNKNLPIFFTPDFLRAAGRTIAFFFGEPTRYMACIGVTGTKGKTTTTSLCSDGNAVSMASSRCRHVSRVEISSVVSVVMTGAGCRRGN